MTKLTATQILDHEEYFNPHYIFDGEEWSNVTHDGFTRYAQSNRFRVKSLRTNKILKMSTRTTSNYYFVSLQHDNGKFKIFDANTLFEGFDAIPDKRTEFIYNMF